METQSKSSGFWKWFIVAIIVAILAVATIYYIGWFDNNTHVDTPAGDNVEQNYQLSEPNADQPGEADWQNTEGQSLREVITEPASASEVPPTE